jgi:hypothetical protein
MITLLIVAFLLIGVVAFMVYKITAYRKEANESYSMLSGGTEMVETVHF